MKNSWENLVFDFQIESAFCCPDSVLTESYVSCVVAALFSSVWVSVSFSSLLQVSIVLRASFS